MTQIDPIMFGLAFHIANFIETGEEKELLGVFAKDVTIVENFAPYIFRDVATWRTAMRAHVRPLSELHFTMTRPTEVDQTGDRAHFVVRVDWTGKLNGRPFREFGYKSVVLQKENSHWRVAAYAWAVAEMQFV